MRIALSYARIGLLAVATALGGSNLWRMGDAHVGAATLPPWFGDSSRPLIHIAGTVDGAEPEMVVELYPDVPERFTWTPREVRVNEEGEFDLGETRFGNYLVFAHGPERIAHAVHVDPAHERADLVHIFAWPREALAQIPLHDPDWWLAEQQAQNSFVRVWDEAPRSLAGFVFEPDGRPAVGVGVQPMECRGPHSPDGPADEIWTTGSTGSFWMSGSGGADTCGVRIWRGATYQEVRTNHIWDRRVTIQLPERGDERHGEFSTFRRDVDDPRGAWIRGRVVRDGAGVADAVVYARGPSAGNLFLYDHARTRNDGTFAIFVASALLTERMSVVVDARDELRDLNGRQVVHIAPGEHQDGLVVEIGEGVAVSGRVVDETGAPVVGVSVGRPRLGPPTDIDGRFTLRLRWQGRYRLSVDVASEDESAPAETIAPKIDVVRPRGVVEDITVVVKRGKRTITTDSTSPGVIDLGVRLDGHEDVIAASDDLLNAGLYVGDHVISARVNGREQKDFWNLVWVDWGDELEVDVRRGARELTIRVRAPTFASETETPSHRASISRTPKRIANGLRAYE